jgi:hypothetical protein
MSALMPDIICGDITPQQANAAVNAGGKLLKVNELQLKYGKVDAQSPRPMTLIG